MNNAERFLCEHQRFTRRYFMRLGAAGAAGLSLWPRAFGADPLAPELAKALETLEPCLLYTSPSPRDGLLSRMPSSA